MVRASKTNDLPEHRVDVVEPRVRAIDGWTVCQIGEHLIVDSATIHSYCLAEELDLAVYDAFVLGPAVRFCDLTKRRSSAVWGRYMCLRLPVHDPDRWNSSEVSKPLHGVLGLLTGDQWNIQFVPRKNRFKPPSQGRFSIPDSSAVVMPFSDGLDSSAVAMLMEQEYGSRLVRVRLGHRAFSNSRRDRTKRPFAFVPFQVSPKRTLESSARSRGFNFMLLCGIAAHLMDAEEIVVPESGQGALGPVLIPVGQAYEDYRCHPVFTDRMSGLVSAVFGHRVRYRYPRLWYTKGETLKAARSISGSTVDLLSTRSCWRSSRHVSVSGKQRQCGVCAACMLRRMSIHTTSFREDPRTYVWENLNVERFADGAAAGFRNPQDSGAFWEHAIAGVLHLEHLAALYDRGRGKTSIDRQCYLLSGSLEVPENDVHKKLERLLRQHKKEWSEFVDSLDSQSFVAQWINGN